MVIKNKQILVAQFMTQEVKIWLGTETFLSEKMKSWPMCLDWTRPNVWKDDSIQFAVMEVIPSYLFVGVGV